MIESVPCWAPTSPPETGASSVAIPRSDNCIATVGWIVDMSIHRSGSAATIASATDSTAARVRQHRDHDVGARGLLEAHAARAVDRLRRAVVDEDVVAGGHQVARHGLAHDAESDEADHERTIQSRVSTVARVGLYSSPTQPV